MNLKAKFRASAIVAATSVALVVLVKPDGTGPNRELSRLLQQPPFTDDWRAIGSPSLWLQGMLLKPQMYESPTYRSVWHAMPRLVRKLMHEPVDLSGFRGYCAQSLGQVEPATTEIIEALTEALHARRDEFLVVSAATSLERIAKRRSARAWSLRGAEHELSALVAETHDPDCHRFLASVLRTVERYEAEPAGRANRR